MKRYIILLVLTVPFLCQSQIVTDKDVKSWGYGEKKMSKAPKKIFVNKFFVNYQVLSSNSETAIDKDFNKAKTEMAVGLVGLELEDFQELTNAAYNRAIKKLTGAGFEIISADEAANAEMFAEYTRLEGGTPSKAQLMGYISTAPEGYSFFVKKITKKGKGKSAFFDVTPKLSKQLGVIPIFELNANFQFVTIEGSSFAGASKMKGKVSYMMPATAVAQSAEGIFGSKVETSPTLGRVLYKGKAAGAGSESIVQVSPKGDIEIPGVVQAKKFKEYAAPDRSYNPSFHGLVFANERSIEVSHQVEADREAYKKQTLQALNEYIDAVLDIFIANANK